MKRRIMCAFLSVCMTLTLFPVEALAAPEDSGEGAELTIEAAEQQEPYTVEAAERDDVENAAKTETAVTTEPVRIMPVVQEDMENAASPREKTAVQEERSENAALEAWEPAAMLMNVSSTGITPAFTYYGTASLLSNNVIQLTSNDGGQAGSVWYPDPIDTSSGITVSFDYVAFGKSADGGPGSDGMCLNLTSNPGLGPEGGSLGFAGNGYGVELDSYYYNSNDLPYKHISIIQNEVNNHLASFESECVNDGSWHNLTVSYVPDIPGNGSAAQTGTLTVYLDFTAVLSLKDVKLGNSIYAGISGSTGFGTNYHWASNFTISDKPFSSAADVKTLDSYADFMADEKQTSFVVPDTVSVIGKDAFRDCAKLTAITIPDSVMKIENGAFAGCTGLTSITLPGSIRGIPDEAFSGCSALTSITIPDSVTMIGKNAFSNCAQLVSVPIPDILISIGDSAFMGCSNLNSISLPDGIMILGQYVFAGCPLTALTFPRNLYSVGKGIFANRSGQLDVTINYLSGYISWSDVFSECAGKISLVITDGGIHSYSFYSCSALSSVMVYGNVTEIDDNAFYGCTGLTSITIPDSVTSIGSSAFYGCTGLTSITIPDSVTSIGSEAFYGCTGLASITIPDSVTSIGSSAFYGCTGLASITIPDSVTVIGGYTFAGCINLKSFKLPDYWPAVECIFGDTGLTSVTIPANTTEIAAHVFRGCTGLTSITIPDSVTVIHNGAFANCASLISVTLPKDLTVLGDDEHWWEEGVFENCSRLTSVTVPDSVTSIGRNAFRGCTGLTSFSLPEFWPSIYGIFSGCTGLTSITIPDSVTSIGGEAFRGCSGLTSIAIPDSVTEIGDSAFSGCTGLTSITIPDSVTSIGSEVFRGCSGLTSIAIPDSVTSIEWSAFSDCTGLTSFSLPDYWPAIGGFFSGCTGLTSITIPDSVTSIGSEAFRGCSGLTSITIPNSVTSIEWSAFYGCTGLTSVTIPDSVTSIGSEAFRGCSGLTSITIPDSVTEIGDSAFSGCTGLTSFSLPNYWPAIGGIFSGCTSLTSITIPDSATSIGSEAFRGCSGLTSITIPDSVTEIGDSAFSGCTGLTSFSLPNYWPAIGGIFSGCTSLTSITIPDSATSIGSVAFRGCTGLTSITIPDKVTSIGWSAFSGCTNLASMIIPEAVESIEWDAFNNCENLTLYVFSGSFAEEYAIENNLKYRYLADSVFVNLTVKTPDGSVLTDGFSVAWTDEGGNYFTKGTSVGLDKGGHVFYQVSLGEDFSFLYGQPEKQTLILDADKTSVEAVCTLSALPAVTIRGRVVDESGAAVSGASVAVRQTANQKYDRTMTATTDADGNYCVDGFPFPATVTVSANGYYTSRKSFSVTADEKTYSADDIAMTAVPENRFMLSLKRRNAAENGIEPTLTTLSNADGLSFTAYNVAQNKQVSGDTLQYPYLVLGSQAKAGDTIRVSVTDENNTMTMEPAEGVYGGEPSQELELTLVENGHIAASLSGPKRIRAMLFDRNGAFIRQYADNGAAFDSGPLTAGGYQVVFMENSSLLSAVPDVARLGQLGLENGKDYVLKSADVENGVINSLGSVKVPELDLQRFVIVEKAYTSVTVNKAQVAAGQVVSVRVQYKLQDRYKNGTGQMVLELPPNCALLNGGVSVNGGGARYELDRRTLKVTLTGESGVVNVCVSPETSGKYTICCFLNWTMSGGVTTLQSVGSAFFDTYAMKMNAPEKTNQSEIVVSGQSYSGGKVTVYDNGESVGNTTVRAGGTWSMSIELADDFLYGFHDLYAVVKTKDGRRAVSETCLVIYDSSFVDMDSLTMLNNGQRITLSFRDDSNQFGTYIYNPSYPFFTFVVSTDADKDNLSYVHDVFVVTTDSEGTETWISCQYRDGTGWVGGATFSTEKVPVAARAAYVCDTNTDQDILNDKMAEKLIKSLENIETEVHEDIKDKISVGDCVAKDGMYETPFIVETEHGPAQIGQIQSEMLDFSTFRLNDWEKYGYTATEYEDGTRDYSTMYVENGKIIELYVLPEQKYLRRDTLDLTTLNIPESSGNSGDAWTATATALKYFANYFISDVVEDFSTDIVDTFAETMYGAFGPWKNYQRILERCLDDLDKIIAKKCKRGEYRLLDREPYERWSRVERVRVSYYRGAVNTYVITSMAFDYSVGKITNLLGKFADIPLNLALDKFKSKKATRYFVKKGAQILIGEGTPKAIQSNPLLAALTDKNFMDTYYQELLFEIMGKQDEVMRHYRPCNDDTPDDLISTSEVGLSPIIDPSGYVCEAVPSNRLEGVTATAWYQFKDPETEQVKTVQWDAAEYDQTNPVTTNTVGGYAWDVPVGQWQVRFEKEGYESAQSDWLPVPPPQTEVNIALVSKASPMLSGLSVYNNEARLEFSQYMKPETVTAERVQVKADGNTVSGTVQAVNLEASFDDPSVSFASVYRFITDKSLEGNIEITVDAGVENYAGTAMAENAVKAAVVERKPVSLTAPKNVEIGMGDTETITVQVFPEGAGANRKISVTSNVPSVISAEEGTTDASGAAQIPVACLLPGSGELRFTLDGTDLTAVTTVNYESVLESLDGEEIPPVTYALTVTGGTGSGEYEQDAEVTIKADEPAESMQFHEWIGADSLTFVSGDSTSTEATFKMPPRALTLTASYENTAPQDTHVDSVGITGQEVRADITCSDTKATVYCAVYASSGKMAALKTAPITSARDYVFSFESQPFDYAKVFVLDANLCPLCKASESKGVRAVRVTGQDVEAMIHCPDDSATAYCAVYASNGKMAALKTAPINSTHDYVFSFEGQQFDYAKVFVLDESLRPLCEAKGSVGVERVRIAGQTVETVINCAAKSTVAFCVTSDSNRRMVSMDALPITDAHDYVFSFDRKQYDYAKVFILGAGLHPLYTSASVAKVGNA